MQYACIKGKIKTKHKHNATSMSHIATTFQNQIVHVKNQEGFQKDSMKDELIILHLLHFVINTLCCTFLN